MNHLSKDDWKKMDDLKFLPKIGQEDVLEEVCDAVEQYYNEDDYNMIYCYKNNV